MQNEDTIGNSVLMLCASPVVVDRVSYMIALIIEWGVLSFFVKISIVGSEKY